MDDICISTDVRTDYDDIPSSVEIRFFRKFVKTAILNRGVLISIARRNFINIFLDEGFEKQGNALVLNTLITITFTLQGDNLEIIFYSQNYAPVKYSTNNGKCNVKS